METQRTKTEDLLYLDQITLQSVLNREYTLRLFVENQETGLHTQDNRIWTPTQRPDISPTSKMLAEIQIRSGHSFWAKHRQTSEIIDLEALFNDYWNSTKGEFTVPKVIEIGKYRCSIELQFSANTTAESLRLALHELEGLLKECNPLMSGSMEKAVEMGIKYGAVFAELNPITKAVFGIAGVTFELLKERNKYDRLPSGLLRRLQRIVPMANKVADEIVCEETDVLEKIIPQMFEVMHRVAKFSCDYVRHGGPAYREKIEEMDEELTGVIECFMRAVDVEALRFAKETEQRLLLERLKPVSAGHDLDHCCMEGTRQTILSRIVAWVAEPQERSDIPHRNTYWLYGSPGIGKTSLAHSICASLYKGKHLSGAFFCRRDDPNLSETRNILPNLIYKLAITFPPFRNVVAQRLRNDANLAPESMEGSLFLELLRSLPCHPKYTLAFVIDALDECGNPQSRPGILRVLTEAATQAPWLRVIITSRPEADIQRYFNPVKSSYVGYDLATDQNTGADLRAFAQNQFDLVAERWYLPTPWPEESLFNRVTSQANGLFIFIKTIILAIEHREDPTEALKAALHDTDRAGLSPLYGLYSSILRARITPGGAGFRQMIGVLLLTAPYRVLSDEAIAELAGVRLNLVKKWIDDLSSLLYRDNAANGGIRIRHLSISDFFFSGDCHGDYQVRPGAANTELGIACLKTMIGQLRVNICDLEDSRIPNNEIHDLQSRIEQNISEALQYSSLYWSHHLCSTPDNGDKHVWASLKEFFEGLYPLFWVEVLSLTRMVPMGVPSIRRVISWTKNPDTALPRRLKDFCRFMITFHTPISISAPHIYISTQPFMPSDSPLSPMFNARFTKVIKVESGKLLSWPAPPLRWRGHAGTVTCLCFSPDGLRIISGSLDKTIRVWDVETGTVVGEPLEGHTGRVYSVAYSPDGRHIISGSEDRTIRIWDAETGAVVGEPLKGHTQRVTSVAYSPDERHIVSGSYDMTIRIWDFETGVGVGEPLGGHTGPVRSVAYSPDGLHVISGSSDITIRIWEAATGAAVGEPLRGHTGEVLSVAYSPNGQRIISGSTDNSIRIWDALTGAIVGRPLTGHSGYIWSIAFCPDGRQIISGSSDRTIRIWDAKTGNAVTRPLKGHGYLVYSVACSSDGQRIISGSSDSTIRMWDAKTGAAIGNPLEEYTRTIRSVAYSPDERRIISGSSDGGIQIWDSRTGAAVVKLEGHSVGVRSVAYSPNGQHIISGSDDKTIRIWDAESGAVVGRPLRGHTGIVYSVAPSSDWKHIISGAHDNTIKIWDVETGATIHTLQHKKKGEITSVAYSPDGQQIISGSSSKIIQIWDTKTGAEVGTSLIGHSNNILSVSFSPDGQHIISGSSDWTIRIWDAKTGTAVGKPLEGHTGPVASVTYSHDGQRIISGSADGTIRTWDSKTGVAIGTPLRGHSSGIRSVTYSPSGQHIVSGSRDSTIRVWDSFTYLSDQPPSSCNPVRTQFHAQPDPDGWVRDPEGGLLYWVPPDHRAGLHSPSLLTISLTPDIDTISLDFENVAFGTSWAQIFSS